MNTLEQLTVGEYVANDFRTAALFSKYGIDFCCKGNRTLEEVCIKKNINPADLENEINSVLESKNDNAIDFKSWSPTLLIDYIIEKHHSYVEEKSVVLLQFLDKLCKVHGERHPELFEINSLFKMSAGDLAQHMKKEELILFPFIQKMVKAQKDNQPIQEPHFGTVENPIAMMKDEHSIEGERFDKIATLTDGFTPPEDACSTYKVTYQMLKEFEQDLHKHIHLENNILFLKAIELQLQFQ
ncbi:iron-sulfur cluster repair di-iron protein [Flavobacterium azooxidireducens]|uniref:Iron-sulfur cluster repair di-iron protein n=1 Tax=Flavobacterium azooxidireducens TaxID=1871076 RepID=A0ABY4KCX0_9FLAO|nr:iron-sulfur cluster repair di-iron protein [Flavobacterium azooxidireducens]UPQ78176.1 iron-sulfur cluster repair di-iron protein [Flavobacterium azooxidireducens]